MSFTDILQFFGPKSVPVVVFGTVLAVFELGERFASQQAKDALSKWLLTFDVQKAKALPDGMAAFHHLPATYALRDYTEVGGLMSYGSNIADGYRQVGNYVGRVLKGAKPADLPIVQANKFELVINMQTARMLDIAVPSSLIAIADELIE